MPKAELRADEHSRYAKAFGLDTLTGLLPYRFRWTVGFWNGVRWCARLWGIALWTRYISKNYHFWFFFVCHPWPGFELRTLTTVRDKIFKYLDSRPLAYDPRFRLIKGWEQLAYKVPIFCFHMTQHFFFICLNIFYGKRWANIAFSLNKYDFRIAAVMLKIQLWPDYRTPKHWRHLNTGLFRIVLGIPYWGYKL